MDMKTKLNFNNAILNLLFIAFFLAVSSNLTAQEKTTSVEGIAWIDLSFNLKNDQTQAIDEYGMTELNKVSSKKDSNLADFLFTITKTDSGIKLKGIEGTAWIDLSFSLTKNKKQAFDQYGVTILD